MDPTRQDTIRTVYLEQIEDHAREIIAACEALRTGKHYREAEGADVSVESKVYCSQPSISSITEDAAKLESVYYSLINHFCL